jgi:hypothetical protein
VSDLDTRLAALRTAPVRPPAPIAHVRARARGIRRRRRLARTIGGAIGLVALVGVLGGVLPLIGTPATVLDAPGDRWERYDDGVLSLTHPPGWTVEDGGTGAGAVVLSSRPLSSADAEAALLARQDVVFGAAFPADAVVFVVGGDRGLAPSEPDGGLGEAVALPAVPPGLDAPVLLRRGRVAGGASHLAAYIGPAAADTAVAALDAVAGSVEIAAPLPPPGGPPPDAPPLPQGMGGGIDDDLLARWRTQLPDEVLEVPLDDDEVVVVRADDDCVAIEQRVVGEPLNDRIVAHTCSLSTPDAGSATVLLDLGLLPITFTPDGPPAPGGGPSGPPPDPFTDRLTLVVARVAPDVARVGIDLVDGRVVPAATRDDDELAIALTDGRPVRLVATTADGVTTAVDLR